MRGAGGVSSDVEDLAGTIFKVDQDVQQSAEDPEVSTEVKENGDVFAVPASPPFELWDTSSVPPESDRYTDRPYCVLRWHEASKSFYICAFSGVDMPRTEGKKRSFSKNLTDAILRFDTRTMKWSEVERHDIQAGGNYPHHDPALYEPPHGWLNGPDNLLPIGNWLYTVAKDNSILVRYDLSVYIDNPEAGYAPSEPLLGALIETRNAGWIELKGHSALAHRGEWLYIASRTSSHIIRMEVDNSGNPAVPPNIELVALFDPYAGYDAPSADITDMDFDSKGRLYIVNAQPSRVHRFFPDSENIYDARNGSEKPWINFAHETRNPRMKSENILIDSDNVLYITTGDGYDFQYGAAGTVYKVRIED